MTVKHDWGFVGFALCMKLKYILFLSFFSELTEPLYCLTYLVCWDQLFFDKKGSLRLLIKRFKTLFFSISIFYLFLICYLLKCHKFFRYVEVADNNNTEGHLQLWKVPFQCYQNANWCFKYAWNLGMKPELCKLHNNYWQIL